MLLKQRIEAQKRRVNWAYRKVTWQNRVLPDIIIVGAMKAGTTSLFAYLRQHPHLLPSFRKEIHFFDGGLNPEVDTFERGQRWYRAHFPLREDMGVWQKTFEASPFYIFNPLAPQRIFDLTPQTKIIALLRNPSERAVSHYFHEKRKNRETLPIREAFQKEEVRLEQIVREEDYKSNAFIHQSYKKRGLYREQLERYFNLFPREQVLVIKSEDLYAEPGKCLKKVFEFAGVDADCKVENLVPKNVAKNRSDVAPEVYDDLNTYFAPHNRALYELIGEDYGW